MPDFRATRSRGYEGKSESSVGLGGCTSNFILKIDLCCCFSCNNNVTCRLAQPEPVGMQVKMSFLTLFLVPVSRSHSTNQSQGCGRKMHGEQRMRHSACGFIISSLWPQANYLTSLLPFPLLPHGSNNTITGRLWALISICRALWRWKAFNDCWGLLTLFTFSKCY